MLNDIIKFCLKNRLLIVAIYVVLLLWWGFTLTKLPIDVLPDLNRPTVTIFAEKEWLSPEEIENLVTFPIERWINGSPWITSIRSVSSIWLWIINVEFDWWSDIYRNRQIITEKLQSINLPKNSKTTLGPTTSLLGEIVWWGLSSPKWTVSPMELRSIADWTIRQRLLTIPWVANVLVMWWEAKQYQVLVKPEKLIQYGITIDEVLKSIEKSNENRWWGFLIEWSKESPIRIIWRTNLASEIKKVVVKNVPAWQAVAWGSSMWGGGAAVSFSDLKTISVWDVADVIFAPDPNRRWDALIAWEPWVILRIIKQPDVNTLELTKNIDTAFEDLQKNMPKDTILTSEIFKQQWFIEWWLSNVEEALRDSAIMVLIILSLFLMNIRTTAITLTAIPISILITFIIFKFMWLWINVMTLGWLVVAIWELVDDAIVDVENVFRRLRENSLLPSDQRRRSLTVIYEASSEVRNSIVYATILVVVVFLPLLFLPWVDGKLLAPIWTAYILSLISSLFVSLTIVPVLCYYLLPKYIQRRSDKMRLDPVENKNLPIWFEPDDTAMIKKVKTWALFPIHFSLKHPKKILIWAISSIVITVALFMQAWKEWLPTFNEPTYTTMMYAPIWSSLEYTKNMVKEVSAKVLKVKWVKSFAATVGRADADAHASGVNSSEFEIWIDTDIAKKKDIENDIQAIYDSYKWKALFTLWQPITHRLQMLISWVRAPIVLKLYWKDLDTLQTQAQNVLAAMKKTPWVINAQVEQELKVPQVAIYTDRDASLYNWVNIWMMNEQLEMSFMWMQATEVLDWNERYPIIVKYDPSWKWEMAALGNTLVPSWYEKPVTLNQLSVIQKTEWQNAISHDWAQRRIIISWFVKDRDVVSVVEDIKSNIGNIKMPDWYFVSYEWDYKNQKEASQRLFIISIIVIIWVTAILYWHFRSMLLVWQIFLDVFTAFLGWMIAIAITWNVVSTAHLVWFISLIWIVSRNGIMLLSHYLHLLKVDKMEWSEEMVIKWSLERVTPVMMTALTASLALIPLLIAWDATWKEFLNPLATVIFGWIILSTIVELFIRPWIFYAFGKKAAHDSINFSKEDI